MVVCRWYSNFVDHSINSNTIVPMLSLINIYIYRWYRIKCLFLSTPIFSIKEQWGTIICHIARLILVLCWVFILFWGHTLQSLMPINAPRDRYLWVQETPPPRRDAGDWAPLAVCRVSTVLAWWSLQPMSLYSFNGANSTQGNQELPLLLSRVYFYFFMNVTSRTSLCWGSLCLLSQMITITLP